MKDNPIINHLLASFTIFVWGITFVCTKHLEYHFSALEILFIRYFIAYIALWILCPKLMPFKSFKDELYIFGASLSGASLYQYLENLSVVYTSPSSVSFITAIAPIFTALLAHKYLGEKITVKLMVGMFVSLVGVFFICFGDAHKIETGLLGDIIIFCTVWLWAIYSVLIKKLSEKGYTGFQLTRRIFFYSLLSMIPFMLLKEKPMDYSGFTGLNTFFLFFLGFFASALCFATWNRSVETLGATTSSKYLFVMPVITLVCQAFYDSSAIGIYALLGMFITLLGIGITEFDLKRIKK